jgi:hypothetical protein
MTISAKSETASAFTPLDANGMKQARIFDTSQPGTNNDNGDPDLGSPNNQCPIPGPGKGSGGIPGAAGENCVPLGNVLIIQEGDKDDPDDNWCGGNFTFKFDTPVDFNSLGLADIDVQPREIEVHMMDGSVLTVTYDGYGNNAVQTILIGAKNVVKVVVIMPGSGAVTFLDFCLSLCAPIVEPRIVPPQFDCDYHDNSQQCLYDSNVFDGVDSDPFSSYVATSGEYSDSSPYCDPLNWNIEYTDRIYHPLNDTTTFIYTVSNLKDNDGNSKDISHTVIGWTGTCCAVGASYFGAASSIKPAGPNAADPTTGVVGIKFDTGWESCPKNADGERISEHRIEMAGDVPLASDATRASIKGGNGYCLYLLDGPSCPCY